MKSIMEEASSVAKAIEKGWERAGKPSEFTVKVFEESEKGFLGLTTSKPAKIALFFSQTVSSVGAQEHPRDSRAHPHRSRDQQQQAPHHRDQRQERTDRGGDARDRKDTVRRHPQARDDRRFEQRPAQQQERAPQAQVHRERPAQQQRPAQPERAPQQSHDNASNAPRAAWNDEMTQFAKAWLTECLFHIGLPNIALESNVSGNTLAFMLSSPVADGRNERFALQSLSHLLTEALRSKFKQDMRSLRITMYSNSNNS